MTTTIRLNSQLHTMRQRVQNLYLRSNGSNTHNEVLEAAFEELALALEELKKADDALHSQHEVSLNNRVALETECKRYQDLFNHAPAGYLVTSLDGTIRQANLAAVALLHSTERALVGRSLALFVPEGQRRAVRAKIAQLTQADRAQTWELSIQPWQGPVFDASLTAGVLRAETGRPVALYWLLRDMSERKRAEAVLQEHLAAEEQRAAAANAEPDTLQAGELLPDDGLAQRQFAFLAEASVLLAGVQDVDTTLAQVAHLAVPAIADACIIELAEPQDGTIRQLIVARPASAEAPARMFQRRYTPNPPTHRNGQHPPLVKQERIATGLANLENLAYDAELRAILDVLTPTSAIVMPLQSHRHTLGSLTLLLAVAERRYGPTDLALAQELARQITRAVERAQLYDKSQR